MSVGCHLQEAVAYWSRTIARAPNTCAPPIFFVPLENAIPGSLKDLEPVMIFSIQA